MQSNVSVQVVCQAEYVKTADLQRRFRRKGVKVNNWEHLVSWLSPKERGAHTPWWTFIFATAILVIFFFMAGLAAVTIHVLHSHTMPCYMLLPKHDHAS